MVMTTENVWKTFNVNLKQFILKRVVDEDNAEDILQEVFVKIHTRIHTLRDQEKLPGWIYQITRNAIYDYYRAQRDIVALPESATVIAEETLNDSAIEELLPCIRDMVERLPTEYRQALILTEYDGLSQKELAGRLGISYSGAKSRVQRAREKLKTMLLDCCHFQFDRSGRVIDYQPRLDCCPPAEQECASCA
ncbi:MAG TPA: RNA polymerase sigma factor SigZ [Ktedonobacteraceae bacterium]|nr:RNA polymerase sigma factor SigZ [Ktedonobacteraceae bacterium]